MTVENIVRYIMKNVGTNNDLYAVITTLFRIYIDNAVKNRITSFVDNSYDKVIPSQDNPSKFVEILDELSKK